MYYLIIRGVFPLLVIIYVPPIILDSNINAVVFDSVILLRFMKMVKCLPEFEYFYCILDKKKLYFKK